MQVAFWLWGCSERGVINLGRFDKSSQVLMKLMEEVNEGKETEDRQNVDRRNNKEKTI